MTGLWVFLAGCLGAVCRFAVDKATAWVLRHWQRDTKARQWHGWGIIIVNLTGCFLVGYVATSPLFAGVSDIMQAGFLGGYTTFSTAIMDTIAYTWKPCFSWKYALRATLLVGLTMGSGLGCALAGASLNT